MKFDELALRSLIEQGEKRFMRLHEKVERRHAHFHNLADVDPQLAAPFNTGPKFQTDELRRIHSALKARLVENHFTVTCTPRRDISSQRTSATLMEQYFNDGLRLIEERENFLLQGVAADGQIISCYAVLHWSMAKDIWPEVPEPDYLSPDEYEASQSKSFTALYKGDDEDDDAESDMPYYLGEAEGAGGYRQYEGGDPVIRKLSRYRENDDAVQERHRKSCAEAGFPWNVEFIDPRGFMFVKDRSLKDGLAIAIVRREVGLLDYLDELKGDEENDEAVSLNQVDKDIPVFGEMDAPVHPVTKAADWSAGIQFPSESDWGATATVYQVWTRDEFYEVLVKDGVWAVVKEGTHPYKRPPFTIIPANAVFSPDPALMYEPALEGVFRMKPFYDYQMSLMQTISEQIALPYYYWKHISTGAPMLNEKGEKITFQRDSAEAEMAPEGYELTKVDFELNPAFMTAVQWTAEALQKAGPPTGRAEISASTQPWAIRLQQAQESVEPAMLLSAMGRGVREMVRNMAYVHSLPPGDGGFDAPIYTFGVSKDGKVDKEKTEEIDHKTVVTLDFDVTIAAESAAERITKEEHGRQLLADPSVPLTDVHWARDYAGWEDPEERVRDYWAYTDYQTKVRPGLAAAVIREKFGGMAVLGADGAWTGYGGQQLAPGQVLQMKGQRGAQGAPQGGAGAAPATMPNLAPVEAPGTMAMGGQQG